MDPTSKFVAILKETLQTTVFSLGIFLFVYLFIVQPHRIKGDSMLPNFVDGELLLTERIDYYFHAPRRGDVIVFQAPGRKVDFIKRIIGLPGENIKIAGGVIFVDGKELKEPYEIQETRGDIDMTVSVNQYFVLGDNRGSSSDSRSFGLIEKSSIRGRAWLVYFPIWGGAKYKGARFVSGADYGIPNSFDNI